MASYIFYGYELYIMKIIFLDIDGVINTVKSVSNPRVQPEGFTANLYGVSKLDPDCVARLNKITNATGAKMVISSSWRILFDDIELLAKYLHSEGVTGEIIGRTPRFAKSYVRGEMTYGRGLEIQEWLSGQVGIESIVILDDDSDMLHLSPFLIKTGWQNGLEDHHVDAAIEMLK